MHTLHNLRLAKERLCEKAKAIKASLANLAVGILACGSKDPRPQTRRPPDDDASSSTVSLELAAVPTRLYRPPSFASSVDEETANSQILSVTNKTPFRLVDFAGPRPERRVAMARQRDNDEARPSTSKSRRGEYARGR